MASRTSSRKAQSPTSTKPKRRRARESRRTDVSDRVRFQAAVRPYQRDSRAPLARPLRIYTLDPSVSDRLGGVATVLVPSRAGARSDRVALRRQQSGRPEGARADGAEALNLDDPHLLLFERPLADTDERPFPHADGVCRLQFDVRRVQTRARQGYRVGDDGSR